MPIVSRYQIPKGRYRIELRVSNSRFITTIGPAMTVKDADAFRSEIREEMPDATHHVYAFKIGYGPSVTEGMSDDGEPSGTAGPPALAVMRGSDVGDVVLVITRYFGGTKLGTGGLVSAYTAAAKAAFDALETEEKVHRRRFELVVSYPIFEQTKRLLTAHECIVENEEFGEGVRLCYAIPEEKADELAQAMKDLTAGRIEPKALG